MNDPFIPLVPRGSKSVAPSEPAIQPFKTLASAATAASAHASAHTATVPPEVTLKREGDRVTHISVRCSCGEVIELACAY